MLGTRVETTPITSWQPPKLPDHLVTTIRNEVLPAYEAFLKPAPVDPLGGRIHSLRAHFYISDVDQRASLALNTDWLNALRPYPFWAVQLACTSWLETETRKPAIADIKQRCEVLVHNARTERQLLCKLLEAQGPKGA